MKKIFQKIRLWSYKSILSENSLVLESSYEYYVLYQDGTYESVLGQSEVYEKIQKDHIKPIRYIFDATDRIILDRRTIVEDNITGEVYGK